MVEADNGMQLDLFDALYKEFKFDKNKPVRLIETFAGVGTQRMGFERAGIEVDVIAIVEVDKHAVLSYASMHTDYLEVRDTWFNDKDITKDTMVEVLQNKMLGYDFKNSKHTITERNNIEIVRDFYLADHLSKNLGDISKVKGCDLPQGIDMLTYSFPCTDLSKAGQQKGLTDTRSGLVYQVFRIVEELKALNNKPKTLLMENVVDLIQKKFINEFQDMQVEVENFGYINYTMRLNAKDFGVAQNRDRVFMLSIPKEHNYNEPQAFKLPKRLKDYLEDEVDNKFYLSDRALNGVRNTTFNSSTLAARTEKDGVIPTLCARDYKDPKLVVVKEETKKGYADDQNGMIQALKTIGSDVGVVVEADGLYLHDSERFQKEPLQGLSRCLKANKHDAGVVIKDIPICLNPKVNGKQPSLQDRIYSDKGTTPAITTGFHPSVENNLRIRKLTPLECWRLMGIDDEYFYKAQQVTSNSQLYKQAGNAIVVDVFAEIVRGMM